MKLLLITLTVLFTTHILAADIEVVYGEDKQVVSVPKPKGSLKTR